MRSLPWQIRSETNFDYTRGGQLSELCIRLTRTNLGVALGTADEPENPPINVVYMCQSTSPSRFRDNTDGTYSILLPALVDLTDPDIIDDGASLVPWLNGNANDYNWRTNVVVRGTHDLEVRHFLPFCIICAA